MSQSNEHYLATTALREYWDTEKKIVLLGDFCRPYPRKELDEGIQYAHILDTSYNAKSYLEAISTCQSTGEVILPIISAWLNDIHRVSHSNRYWRILIGPFLLRYINILFEKYSRINKAKSTFPDLHTWGIHPSNYITPHDTLQSWNLFDQSDPWHLQLATQIIEKVGGIALEHKEIDWSMYPIPNMEFRDTDRKLHSMFQLEAIRKAIVFINPRADSTFNLSSTPLTERMKLVLFSKSKMWPFFNLRANLYHDLKPESTIRQSLCHKMTGNIFHDLILESLVVNFPSLFIERYEELQRIVDAIDVRSPRVILSDVGWYFDEVFKTWAAKKADEGVTLVAVQHGGSYGDVIYSQSEEHEKEISNFFISWGWSDSDSVIPLPSQRIRQNRRNNRSNSTILLACTCPPRYQGPQTLTFNKYLEDQFRFVDALDEQLTTDLLVRLYFTDYGWNVGSVWNEKFPNVRIEQAGEAPSFNRRLKECRLLVGDNCNTTILQALAQNIPTILFWDMSQHIHRDSSLPYYELIEEVGIFHHSPESAAMKISEISNDIYAWWNSQKVQTARTYFTDHFARTDRRWISTWINTIRKIT